MRELIKTTASRRVKVNSKEALYLYNAGLSYRAIRNFLSPKASVMSVYRAVRRAKRMEEK